MRLQPPPLRSLAHSPPPHDEAAEAAVIGAMLCESKAAAVAREMLRESDFYLPRHRVLFAGCVQTFELYEALDELTLCNVLADNLEAAGGRDYIGNCVFDTIAAHVETYCQIVKEKSKQRAYIEAAQRLETAARRGDAETLRAAIKGVETAVEEKEKGWSYTMNLCDTDEIFKMPDRIKTNLPNLDEKLNGGLARGGFYILAACTGDGKSTVGRAFALKIAHDHKVYFFSYEDGIRLTSLRMIAALAKVPYNAVESFKTCDVFTQDRIQRGREQLRALPLAINEHDNQLGKMEQLIRAGAKEGGQVFFVDQLSWLQPDDPAATAIERNNLATLMLKKLARELDVVIMAMAQINRAGRKERDEKMEHLQPLHIQMGGEQDADGIIIIQSVKRETYPYEMKVSISKHRHGPIHSGLFEDLPMYVKMGSGELTDIPNGF